MGAILGWHWAGPLSDHHRDPLRGPPSVPISQMQRWEQVLEEALTSLLQPWTSTGHVAEPAVPVPPPDIWARTGSLQPPILAEADIGVTAAMRSRAGSGVTRGP